MAAAEDKSAGPNFLTITTPGGYSQSSPPPRIPKGDDIEYSCTEAGHKFKSDETRSKQKLTCGQDASVFKFM